MGQRPGEQVLEPAPWQAYHSFNMSNTKAKMPGVFALLLSSSGTALPWEEDTEGGLPRGSGTGDSRDRAS